MIRSPWALLMIATTAEVAWGQFPVTPSLGVPSYPVVPNVMPNIYNPRYQPLSPYLNLLAGGNPSVNYYYGVRPGTVGGTGFPIGAPFMAAGGNRPLFFPQLSSPDSDNRDPRVPGQGDVLPPAGHPVQFNNTMGYFPSPFGNRSGGIPRR